LVEEPIDYLGTVWFSAKELGVEPIVIERLYNLQTVYIQTASLKEKEVEEMDQIHASLQLKLKERITNTSTT
jgi:membrane protein YdbS with pleckstrin-like domain